MARRVASRSRVRKAARGSGKERWADLTFMRTLSHRLGVRHVGSRKTAKSELQPTAAPSSKAAPTLRFRNNTTERVILELPGRNLYGVDLTGAPLAGAAMYAIEVAGVPPVDGILDIDTFKAHL